eukprot:TRINITY_DN23657_c0_g1_i1.p1 TRINITY_DN23657_c0_g1~~TRINITY_DN23657_c0_g1_i1.p1  ORF type:complete len:1048 (+),score=126.95 TRINITY_DN23657_c0_g1_i1:89-3145(+)
MEQLQSLHLPWLRQRPEEPERGRLSEDHVFDAELAHNKRRVEALRARHPSDAFAEVDSKAEATGGIGYGVAFSGGGTRAAAFHCGVMWRLAERGLLKDMHHMVGVSGGCYFVSSYASYLLGAEEEAKQRGVSCVDDIYKTATKDMLLRMQHNVGYLASHVPNQLFRAEKDDSSLERGSSRFWRIFDWPAGLSILFLQAALSIIIFGVLLVWPVVVSVETFWGAWMRKRWCDPSRLEIPWLWIHEIGFVFAVWIIPGVLLWLWSVFCGKCPRRPPNYRHWLLARSARQLFTRAIAFYAVYVFCAALMFLFQVYEFGVASSSGMNLESTQSVRHMCFEYIRNRQHANDESSASFSCSDRVYNVTERPLRKDVPRDLESTFGLLSDGAARPWYFDHLGMYLNETWVDREASLPETSDNFDYKMPRESIVSAFVTLNVIVIVAGLAAQAFDVPLLRWYLVFAGPAWGIWLVASVGQWKIFGPITQQYFFSHGLWRQGTGSLSYSESAWHGVVLVCTAGALIAIPFYDQILRLVHLHNRRCLRKSFMKDGKDVSFNSFAESIYCPNIIFGATCLEYRRPKDPEKVYIGDFSLTPLFYGGQRTDYLETPSWMRASRAMAISGGAVDAFVFGMADSLIIRMWYAVVSLSMGDFVRWEPSRTTSSPDEKPCFGMRNRESTQKCSNVFDALPASLLFMAAYGIMALGVLSDRIVVYYPGAPGAASAAAAACGWYDFLTSLGRNVFLVVIALCFFTHLRCLKWLMWSPVVLKLQMLVVHHYTGVQAPPLLHLCDGGVVEVLGLMTLIRRKLRLIIVSDACSDSDLRLRALRLVIKTATAEKLCSFYNCLDPERSLDFVLDEFATNQQPMLHIGIRYEDRRSYGRIIYIRARLLEFSDGPVLGHITEEELTRGETPPSPRKRLRSGSVGPGPVGTDAGGATAIPAAKASSSSRPPAIKRSELGGCMSECCHAPGRNWFQTFPNISTGNPFMTRTLFSETCRLGYELADCLQEPLFSVPTSMLRRSSSWC